MVSGAITPQEPRKNPAKFFFGSGQASFEPKKVGYQDWHNAGDFR